MTDDQIIKWLPIAFPFLFVGMWLFISTVMGVMSGWFSLQQWYAYDGDEEPLLKLGWQSGVMGFGVNLNNVLTLVALRSGLCIRMWRLLGPFQKPLLIPWSEITAEPSRSFFTKMVKLGLGNQTNGRLKINAASWAKLVAAAGPVVKVPLPAAPAASQKSIVVRLVLEWVVITLGAAAFFYLAPRFISPPGQAIGLPIAVCIIFPAIVFGIGQMLRFAREN